MIWPDEIRLSGSSVVLGRTPTGQDSEQQINVTFDELSSVLKTLEDANSREIVDQEFSLDGAVITLRSILGEEQIANLAPILHKPINKHTGVSVETTIQTTDSSEMGEMCYITVLRNNTIFMAHDGYGLA